MLSLGVLLAFAAMLFWGFGDFLIQKSARKFGDWGTLLAIEIFCLLILTPFVWNDVLPLFLVQDGRLIILSACSAVLLAAALLNFESLKQGKLAVVAPVHTLEIPVASVFAFLVFDESLMLNQIALVVLLMMGLALVSMRSDAKRRARLEKGALLAVISAIFMGTTTFMFGFSSRAAGFVLTNWFTAAFLAIVCAIYVIRSGGLSGLISKARENKGLMLSTAASDTFAWIAFAFATTLSQISIAVALSECYIIVAALLGLFVNKEPIKFYQKAGLVLAIASAILLAAIS